MFWPFCFPLLCNNGQTSPSIATPSLSRFHTCCQCVVKEELLNYFVHFVLRFIEKMALKITYKIHL